MAINFWTPIPTAVWILWAAAGLDFCLGDPRNWLHPVQVMGWAITQLTHGIFKVCRTPSAQRLAGVGLGLSLIIGSGAIAHIILRSIYGWHPWLGMGVETVMLASCFAGRSLRAAAEDVIAGLQTGDLDQARHRLSFYVGRDTANLSESEILRAVLETVAENGIDGAIAPLVWAIVGSLIPGVGSVPVAIAYKAASTLDSMVGYRSAPYTNLGWFSAKTEDLLTWVPCRWGVGMIALLSGQPKRVIQICRRDAHHDPSPNSGWSECAYAAALDVRLGGVNWYHGTVKEKPLLGDARQPITIATIDHALALTRWSVMASLAIALLLHILL